MGPTTGEVGCMIVFWGSVLGVICVCIGAMFVRLFVPGCTP